MQVFERAKKIEIFDILGTKFAPEAIFARQIFGGIFAMRRILDVQNVENRFCYMLPHVKKKEKTCV